MEPHINHGQPGWLGAWLQDHCKKGLKDRSTKHETPTILSRRVQVPMGPRRKSGRRLFASIERVNQVDAKRLEVGGFARGNDQIADEGGRGDQGILNMMIGPSVHQLGPASEYGRIDVDHIVGTRDVVQPGFELCSLGRPVYTYMRNSRLNFVDKDGLFSQPGVIRDDLRLYDPFDGTVLNNQTRIRH